MSNKSPTSPEPSRPSRRRFVVDFREISYHVAYVEAESEAEAKQMIEWGDYESNHVNTTDWDAFRVAELDDQDEEIAVLHDDFESSWEMT